MTCDLDRGQLKLAPSVTITNQPPLQASQDYKTVGRIICEKAQQFQAQQVFIGGSGSHHRSIVAGALLSSSVEAYVKQHCKVPVTVVVPEVQQGGAT